MLSIRGPGKQKDGGGVTASVHLQPGKWIYKILICADGEKMILHVIVCCNNLQETNFFS